MKHILLIFITLFLSNIPPSFAGPKRFPVLEPGMKRSDVILRAGVPKERIVMETKREEIWNYENGNVVFQEGVVKSASSVSLNTSSNEINLQSSIKSESKKRKKPYVVTNKDMEEFLKEIPSETGPEKSRPDKPSSVIQSAVPMPMDMD